MVKVYNFKFQFLSLSARVFAEKDFTRVFGKGIFVKNLVRSSVSNIIYVDDRFPDYLLALNMSAINAELDWLLQNDIYTTIDQLMQTLTECSFSINNQAPAQHNLLYTSQNQLDTVKVSLTLDGFKIINSDINIKLTSKHPVHTIRTCIKETPWRLFQIQDAGNHLSRAIDLLLKPNKFESAEEASYFISQVMNCLLKGRNSLMIPKKSSIEELQHSQNMQSISPTLPLDFSIGFYIQAHHLVCSIYQLTQSNNRAQVKAEYQAEVGLPYLSDVLVLFSVGLQTCQQFKDKLQTLANGFH